MPAPKRNQFWKKRRSHGRKLAFADPEQLWKACLEYFEWTDANPLWEAKPVHWNGRSETVALAKMRVMTIEGLCVFLGISPDTWRAYRRRQGFSGVTTRAEAVIWVQKFEGAAAGLFNANIIARELKLGRRPEADLSAIPTAQITFRRIATNTHVF